MVGYPKKTKFKLANSVTVPRFKVAFPFKFICYFSLRGHLLRNSVLLWVISLFVCRRLI